MALNQQFIEKFPVATWTTAFFAGMSITVIRMGFDVLQDHDRVSQASHDILFPFVAVYFVSTMLVFVVGIRNIVPKDFRIRAPWQIKREEFVRNVENLGPDVRVVFRRGGGYAAVPSVHLKVLSPP